MAFPQTPLLDDFNRADESPLGGNWSGPVLTGQNQGRIVSNQAASTATAGGSYWNPRSFGDDAEVWLDLSTLSSALAVFLHFDPGAGQNGYQLIVISGSALIRRFDAGTPTTLQTTSVTTANGDAFGLERRGSNLRAYRKPSGGSWGAIGTGPVSDSTYTSGRIAFSSGNATDRFDNFGGGHISSLASPSRMARHVLLRR